MRRGKKKKRVLVFTRIAGYSQARVEWSLSAQSVHQSQFSPSTHAAHFKLAVPGPVPLAILSPHSPFPSSHHHHHALRKQVPVRVRPSRRSPQTTPRRNRGRPSHPSRTRSRGLQNKPSDRRVSQSRTTTTKEEKHRQATPPRSKRVRHVSSYPSPPSTLTLLSHRQIHHPQT